MDKIISIRDLSGRLHACNRHNHNCKECGYAYTVDDILVMECPLTYFGDSVVKHMDECINTRNTIV